MDEEKHKVGAGKAERALSCVIELGVFPPYQQYNADTFHD